jgi:hypothetical protein
LFGRVESKIINKEKKNKTKKNKKKQQKKKKKKKKKTKGSFNNWQHAIRHDPTIVVSASYSHESSFSPKRAPLVFQPPKWLSRRRVCSIANDKHHVVRNDWITQQIIEHTSTVECERFCLKPSELDKNKRNFRCTGYVEIATATGP